MIPPVPLLPGFEAAVEFVGSDLLGIPVLNWGAIATLVLVAHYYRSGLGLALKVVGVGKVAGYVLWLVALAFVLGDSFGVISLDGVGEIMDGVGSLVGGLL